MVTANDPAALAQLLFPDRLVLRFESNGTRKNWPAYRNAVRTFARLRHLESHLIEENYNGALPPASSDRIGQRREVWEAEDELCKAVITLNISGTPPFRIKKAIANSTPARELWRELHRGVPEDRRGDSPESETKQVLIGAALGVAMVCLMAGVAWNLKLPSTERR